ncbi:sigma-70 family RNA polymerase sigma factor [Virgibacillus salexigens]|uniref:Uncharacterized protein n=1 Tax=Virgibacillus kapii TaxID=1638645 RepID=A0ABQ2E1Z5_9BACI|nr:MULTISPECIES: sigma-70 family RNA polymerase sigma factor [Virgibacillus]MYL43932.1 hypothetical protein [Virgibacillus massiliensis]GGJ76999.1 hypothetical protein GCM10007111_43330 [Virgibacillus kapii]
MHKEKSLNEDKKAKIKRIEYYLKNYKFFKTAKKNLNNQINILSTIRMDSLCHHTSHNYEELTKRIRYRLNEAEYIIESVDLAIKQLNSEEKQFIFYRYFENYSIEAISNIIGYSKPSIYLIRQSTMDKLLIGLGLIINFH